VRLKDQQRRKGFYFIARFYKCGVWKGLGGVLLVQAHGEGFIIG
jgi:hypothetical protein